MSAIIHDVLIGIAIVWGMCALCMLAREDLGRIKAGQKLRRAWSRK